MKQGMKVLVLMLALLLSTACAENDRSGNDDRELGNGPSEAAMDKETAPEESERAEMDATPISLRWEESVETASGDVDGLKLFVTNNTGVDLDVAVKLNFTGMIKMSASVDLGEKTVPAKGTELVFVAASDIPIQTAAGASSAIAELDIREENGDAIKLTSSEVYYRHSPDFQSLISFDMSYLIENLGGVLTPRLPEMRQGFQGAAGAAATVLGRMKKHGGEQFSEVRISAEDFVDVVNGEVMGQETGTSLSIGYDAE